MSETKKSNPVAAYEVVQVEENKLKLIEGRYALSKEELEKLDNMIITVGGKYKIEKDPKTGKISRIQDGTGITLSGMLKDKYDRLLKKAEQQKEGIEH